MKIIGPQLAASVLVLPLDDVRPLQGITPQQVVDVVSPRYGFAVRPRSATNPMARLPFPVGATGATGGSPSAIQMTIQMPITLRNGIATLGEQKIILSQLEIIPDVSRVIIHTVTTEEGDVVLDDLVNLLEATCGFRNLRQFSSRQYVSNVIVQFDKGLEDYISGLKEIQDIISPSMQHATGIDQEVRIERLGFAFDPQQIPASKIQNNLTNFILERRQDRLFNENRYFSSAPLRTTDHIQILEKIGAALERRR